MEGVMIQTPPTTSIKKWTFETAIAQIEYCDYEAIGGKLIWNDAFIWLKNRMQADHLEDLEAKCNDCCYLKGFPVAKEMIAVLESAVIQKDHAIKAATLQIAAMSKQIATLTLDRDTAMSMLEDAEARVVRLTAENERLREALDKIVEPITTAKEAEDGGE
jgi:hypothetical protein